MSVINQISIKDSNNVSTVYDISASAENIDYDEHTSVKEVLDNKQDSLTFDNVPTADSTNPVKSGGVYSALENKINTTAIGAPKGVAGLDVNGLVPSTQLPSYVDDVLEYNNREAFPVTGMTGKIYIALDTNLTYRQSGTTYVEISPSLALGITSSTAYRGDYGNTAYLHATDPTKTTATTGGLYKVASSSQGHIASLTPVVKEDITALGIPAQDTTYSEATPINSGLMSASDKIKLNGIAEGATANTGTVTEIVAGAGLTGGPITTSGVLNANLKSTTASNLEAAPMGTTENRQYAVGIDVNGNLSVNIPQVGGEGFVSSIELGDVPYTPTDGVVNLPAYPTALPASDTTDVYSSTGSAPTSGKAVAAALATLGTASEKNVPTSGDASSTEVVLGNDSRLTDSRTPVAHNQTSDTINAMTGYTKPASSSAITTTDTLNEAIGKLEKAIDDAGTGNEFAVAGVGRNLGVNSGVIDTNLYLGHAPAQGDRFIVFFNSVVEAPTSMIMYSDEDLTDSYTINFKPPTFNISLYGVCSFKVVNQNNNLALTTISSETPLTAGDGIEINYLNQIVNTAPYNGKNIGQYEKTSPITSGQLGTISYNDDYSIITFKADAQPDSYDDNKYSITIQEDMSMYFGVLKRIDGSFFTNKIPAGSTLICKPKEGGTGSGSDPYIVTVLSISSGNPFAIYSNGAISTDNGTTKIRFGQDANGNYGYIKDGADTVIPFKNPTGTKTLSYTSNGTYSSNVTDYANVSVSVSVPSSTHTEIYRPSANTTYNDMGATHNYRYVNTSGMITPSGTYNAGTYTTNGSKTISGISNYSNVSFTINVPTQTGHIYGVQFNNSQTGSNKHLCTRTDDAANFPSPTPGLSGISTPPRSPFDGLMPQAGMRTIYSSTYKGYYVEIPKFWYRYVINGSNVSLLISDIQRDNYLVSPAHADRGDGYGERDYVYIAKYKLNGGAGSYPNSTPLTNRTKSSFRSSCHFFSNTQMMDYAMISTIRMLYLVEYARQDSRRVIGSYGSNTYSMGSTGASLSLNYHTGTIGANVSTNCRGVAYRGIEDLQNNTQEYVDGITIKNRYQYVGNNPSTYVDDMSTVSGAATGIQGYDTQWTARVVQEQTLTKNYVLIPTYADQTTGYYYVLYFSGDGAAAAHPIIGGDNDGNSYYGIFSMQNHDGGASGNISSRIMILPSSRLTSN